MKVSKRLIKFLLFLLIGMPLLNSTLRGKELKISEIMEKVYPTVVKIATWDKAELAGAGTGFFISPGKVLTNAYVIKGAYSCVVYRGSLNLYYKNAKLLKIDEEADIALLEVEGKHLPPGIAFAEKPDIYLGQPVTAIRYIYINKKAATEDVICVNEGILSVIEV